LVGSPPLDRGLRREAARADAIHEVVLRRVFGVGTEGASPWPAVVSWSIVLPSFVYVNLIDDTPSGRATTTAW
jgi:hypothetical protein